MMMAAQTSANSNNKSNSNSIKGDGSNPENNRALMNSLQAYLKAFIASFRVSALNLRCCR